MIKTIINIIVHIFDYIVAGILFLILALLFSNGGYRAKAKNPLPEKKIISYVQDKIYKETGDRVIVKIKDKEDLNAGVGAGDIGGSSFKVSGGHSYLLEITNKDKGIIATGRYKDGYVRCLKPCIFNKRVEEDPKLTTDYYTKNNRIIIETDFRKILSENINKYYIYNYGEDYNYEEDYNYNIFVYSPNYETINKLIKNLNNKALKYNYDYHVEYTMYIYKDESAFDSNDFKLYINGEQKENKKLSGTKLLEKVSGKDVQEIAKSGYYSQDLTNEIYASNGMSLLNHEDEHNNAYNYYVIGYKTQEVSYGTSYPFTKKKDSHITVFGIK